LHPRDGRPFPTDERANDAVYRQTVLWAYDPRAAARKVREANVSFVSSEVVANQNRELECTKAFVVRNLDGHAVEIK
jgi:hypothetical protein